MKAMQGLRILHRIHATRVARRLTALVAGVLLVSAFSTAIARASIDATYSCQDRYVTFYQGTTQSGSVRQYCISGDSDMSSEPGNVMGPLGDGNPVVYMDDYDSSSGTSGISSFYFYDPVASPDYTLCIYDGTGYTGSGQAYPNPGYYNDLLYLNDVVSSFKIVSGSPLNCP